MSTSDPVFWWYPEEGAGVNVVDLSEGLTNLIVTPAIRREDAIGYDGGFSTAIYGPSHVVTIILERFGGQSPGANALERQLQAMVNHLRRGGVVAFSRVRSKAWCGPLSGAITSGFSYAPTSGNAFTAWYAAALASGDEVVIESGSPRNRHEVHATTGVTGVGRVDLSDTVIFDYDVAVAGAWARYRDFFPVLYMPADEAGDRNDPITHDARRNWTLRLSLRFSPSMLATVLAGNDDEFVGPPAPGAAPGAALRGTVGGALLSNGSTLDQLVGPRKADGRFY